MSIEPGSAEWNAEIYKNQMAILSWLSSKGHNVMYADYQLCLPAPTPTLLLRAPFEIEAGVFVRFSEYGLRNVGTTHWARRYGNGVGIVKNVHEWRKTGRAILVAFPHRDECWSEHFLERDNHAQRSMAQTRYGVEYGVTHRLIYRN